MARPRSRIWIMAGAAALVAAGLGYAFWPRPMAVDMGMAARADMRVTIDEEARTQVRNAYVVSAPIAGRLLRVQARAGDAVEGGRTVVARMLPANPPALDERTREQARAAISGAEAALEAARADLRKAVAEKDFADGELQRKRQLSRRGIASDASFDEAEREARRANAALDNARATIAMRDADLANQRAQLITFAASAPPGTSPDDTTIPLTAPVSGRILRVLQESETTVAAGTAILEVGDIAGDLEVVAELLSTDAVQVAVGDAVLIRKWGRPETLPAVVARIEPWGFTKTSALGVEEQRVRVIISFTGEAGQRASLGHGFRVEVQIVVWEAKAALTVPSSALFRHGDGWAVFAVAQGRASLTPVTVGRDNGSVAELRAGLAEGAAVVLYPAPDIADGASVERRKVAP